MTDPTDVAQPLSWGQATTIATEYLLSIEARRAALFQRELGDTLEHLDFLNETRRRTVPPNQEED